MTRSPLVRQIRWLRWALGLGFWSLVLGLAALLVVPALVAARARKSQTATLLVVSVVGFSSMASTVLIPLRNSSTLASSTGTCAASTWGAMEGAWVEVTAAGAAGGVSVRTSGGASWAATLDQAAAAEATEAAGGRQHLETQET